MNLSKINLNKILIFLILFIIFVNPVESKTAVEWNNEGVKYYNLGEYEKAIDAFDNGIDKLYASTEKNKNIIYNHKGWALLRLGKYNEAIEVFDTLIAIKGINVYKKEGWYGKGYIYYKLGEYEKAIEALDRAIALDEKFEDPWNQKGWSYYKLGEYNKAIGAFDKAIDLNSRNKGSWNGKGLSYYNLDKYDKAIEAFKRAIALDGKFEAALYFKGQAHYESGDYKYSLITFNKLIDINPDYRKVKSKKEDAEIKYGNQVAQQISITRQIINDERAQNLDVSQALSVLSRSESAHENKDYLHAEELYLKARVFALDVDQDGITNNEDIVPSIHNDKLYAGGTLGFILIIILLKSRSKKKRGKKEEFRRQIAEIKTNQMFREGVSGAILKDLTESVNNSNFNLAEILIVKAKNAIEEENPFFIEIDSISNKIPKRKEKYFKETNELIVKSLDELKEGKYDGANSFAQQLKETYKKENEKAIYENEKDALIREMQEGFI